MNWLRVLSIRLSFCGVWSNLILQRISRVSHKKYLTDFLGLPVCERYVCQFSKMIARRHTAVPTKFKAGCSAGMLTDQPLSMGQEATLSASNYSGAATRTDVSSSVAAHVHGCTNASSVDVVVHRACCSAYPSNFFRHAHRVPQAQK